MIEGETLESASIFSTNLFIFHEIDLLVYLLRSVD